MLVIAHLIASAIYNYKTCWSIQHSHCGGHSCSCCCGSVLLLCGGYGTVVVSHLCFVVLTVRSPREIGYFSQMFRHPSSVSRQNRKTNPKLINLKGFLVRLDTLVSLHELLNICCWLHRGIKIS